MRPKFNFCSRFHFVVLVAATLVTNLLAQAATEPDTPDGYVEGELLVKFQGGPKSQAARNAKSALKHEVQRDFDFIGWQHIRLPAGMAVEEALVRYRKLPNVLAVEPNYVGRLEPSDSGVPNDPLFNGQWALTKISASNAWDFTTGSTNVVVAVIDTGVNHNHEDLGANMWRNPGEIPGNGIDDDGNGYVDDIFGIDVVTPDSDPLDGATSTGFYHGTACAGVIGAVGNNNKGITGLNWTIRIMALRFLSSTDQYTSAGIIECYDYVVRMKRNGINIRATSNSYGTTAPLGQAIYDALDALGNADIVNVFIAGNNSQNNDVTPFNPANFPSPSFISVAATDQADNLASFSSFGPTNVDLAAPGVDIVTTSGQSTNAYYGAPGRSGTSYACPLVAGAVALLASARPAATAAELKAAILNGVDLVPALTNKMVTHGRLNVAKAIQFLMPPAPLITNLSVSPDGRSLSFTWKVQAAKIYRVQYKNNLNVLDWIDLPTVPTINGSIASITDTVGISSQRFYRIVQLD
jgi:subtilisin family serine protease